MEPLARYSSVAANSEANFENSTSSLSLWWRRWTRSKPTSSAVIPERSREQNRSMASANKTTAAEIGTEGCKELIAQTSVRTNVRHRQPRLLRRHEGETLDQFPNTNSFRTQLIAIALTAPTASTLH